MIPHVSLFGGRPRSTMFDFAMSSAGVVHVFDTDFVLGRGAAQQASAVRNQRLVDPARMPNARASSPTSRPMWPKAGADVWPVGPFAFEYLPPRRDAHARRRCRDARVRAPGSVPSFSSATATEFPPGSSARRCHASMLPPRRWYRRRTTRTIKRRRAHPSSLSVNSVNRPTSTGASSS